MTNKAQKYKEIKLCENWFFEHEQNKVKQNRTALRFILGERYRKRLEKARKKIAWQKIIKIEVEIIGFG